jgi:glycosyltransferase involved in cell wall biosynthesis
VDEDFSEVELDSYLNFKLRSEGYRSTFNSKAFPYQLPNINYLGSFVADSEDSSKSEIYIGIPIKNQDEVIFKILNALFESVSCNFSVGVVLDNCTDNTEHEVRKFISERARGHKKLQRFDLLSSDGELFEATCENLLFQFCQEKYFMSLQADIYMIDDSFIDRSIKAFDQNSHLLGISGRAIVGYGPEQKMAQNLATRALINLPNLIAPRIWRKRRLGQAPSREGYFGDTSRQPDSSMQFSAKQLKTIYPGRAIIRGPLIWRSEFFKQLGGFDEFAYFLGRDDCDLSLRGWLQFKYFVAYLPCRSFSNPLEGTTRKPRAPEAITELQKRADLTNSFKGRLGSLWAAEFAVNLEQRPKKQIWLN